MAQDPAKSNQKGNTVLKVSPYTLRETGVVTAAWGGTGRTLGTQFNDQGLTFVPAPDLGGSLCGWPLRAPADRPMAIAFAIVYGVGEWEIYQTDEVAGWMENLRHTDPEAAHQVEAAVDVLSEYGPTLGRPLVDTLTGSKIANLKELRPRQTMIRLLFVFDPWRSVILLTAGDKTGQWKTWYERAIPHSEELYAVYLKERAKEEGQ
jgi:hypothetical protein